MTPGLKRSCKGQPGMPDTIRAFVAIELTETARRYISDLIDVLRKDGVRGLRWVNAQGIHLTLKFLGNVSQERLDAIVEAMGEAAERVRPFALVLQDMGAFPGLTSPRVLWVGVGGDLTPLLQLQARLEQAMAARGFPKESRAFSPHLTLARVRERLSPPERLQLAKAVGATQGMPGVDLPVHAMSLMESTLTREGAKYTRRAQISLPSALAP